MSRLATGHQIQTWSLAWALTGAALVVSDVFSTPRKGPLWVTFVVGIVAWGFAGASSVDAARWRAGAVIWSVAFVVAMWLGNLWGSWFEQNAVGPIHSAGFIGMLLGLSAAAGIGACASAGLWLPGWPLFRSLLIGLAWALGFLVGGYVGLASGYVLGGLANRVVPWPVGFIGGWGVGCALGGLVASGLGLKVRDGLLEDAAV